MARGPKPALRESDWSCPRCGKSGSVTHGRRARVDTVIHLVKLAHRKASPECPDPDASTPHEHCININPCIREVS